MLQEEEEGRAATERLHELANLPKKKARKEGQKLTEDQKKARARENARKASDKKKQAKEARRHGGGGRIDATMPLSE